MTYDKFLSPSIPFPICELFHPIFLNRIHLRSLSKLNLYFSYYPILALTQYLFEFRVTLGFTATKLPTLWSNPLSLCVVPLFILTLIRLLSHLKNERQCTVVQLLDNMSPHYIFYTKTLHLISHRNLWFHKL